ncbi:glucokinase [Endozoicomonadaceae bacterium StTr2]
MPMHGVLLIFRFFLAALLSLSICSTPVFATALVGDIGGTNARFALVEDGSVDLRHVEIIQIADFSTVDLAIRQYLLKHASPEINAVCLAAAGAVADGEVTSANCDWVISRSKLQQSAELGSSETIVVINDFEALALAIPRLTENEKEQFGPSVNGDKNSPILVIGPGTGLGQSLLVQTEGWHALACEGGRADFAPADSRDIEIWKFVNAKKPGKVYWEQLLCGRGLELLYQFCSRQEGGKKTLGATDITSAVILGSDQTAISTVEQFSRLLGHFAGNATVISGAWQGVYIAGGIVPKIRNAFDRRAFREAFEDRVDVKSFMEKTPSWLVLAKYPGLTGAAVKLSMNEN